MLRRVGGDLRGAGIFFAVWTQGVALGYDLAALQAAPDTHLQTVLVRL